MKIRFTALTPASDEEVRRNVAHANSLGFPRLGKAETPRLAVVGGGPSIADRLEEIRAFDGDIWAINGAWKWLKDRGVDAWFYTLDPSELTIAHGAGATKAMLATMCHPKVFENLKGAHIECVHIGEGGFENGPTSASTAPYIGLERGYREFFFYGCECSCAGSTHAYGNFNLENHLRVSCGGEEFDITSDFVMQAELLGAMIRAAPHVFKDCSGGLLAAVIAGGEIDVLAAKPAVHKAMMIEEAHIMGVEEIMSAQHRAVISDPVDVSAGARVIEALA